MKVELAPLESIPEGGIMPVEFFGREVLLTREGDTPRAIVNACMHLGGPLSQEGDRLVCAWHNAEWCIADGKKVAGPGRPEARLMMLPIRVIDGVVNYVYGED